MEFVLARIWANQMSYSRHYEGLAGAKGALHLSHAVASEMVHFINQVQYYFVFEVGGLP